MRDYGETIGEAAGQGAYGTALFLTLICVMSTVPSPDDFARLSKNVGPNIAKKASQRGASTVARELAETAATPASWQELTQLRRDLDLPPVGQKTNALGGKPREVVLTKLEVGDSSYYGMSAWDATKQYDTPFDVNIMTPSHGEGDVFVQAFRNNEFNHATATLIVDKPMCKYCRQIDGVKMMAKQMGYGKLIVKEPMGIFMFPLK